MAPRKDLALYLVYHSDYASSPVGTIASAGTSTWGSTTQHCFSK